MIRTYSYAGGRSLRASERTPRRMLEGGGA